jgi:hypothetical protein
VDSILAPKRIFCKKRGVSTPRFFLCGWGLGDVVDLLINYLSCYQPSAGSATLEVYR